MGRLRRSVGYVPQEAFLFSRSVRENVAFGDPYVSEEQVIRAIEVAQLSADAAAAGVGPQEPRAHQDNPAAEAGEALTTTPQGDADTDSPSPTATPRP